MIAIEPIPFTDVEIRDEFWAPKMEVNRKISIWHCFDMYEETGHMASAKLIEAAAYMLSKQPDSELEAYVDDLIEKTVSRVEHRIHENPESAVRASGHFIEAAVAYYEATGKRTMLDAAVKTADQIDVLYGPGKKTYISGHEGLKIGLIRLYQHTGEARYWKLAKFFLDERGKEDYERTGEYAKHRAYAQDHKPVIEQSEAVGHCVRAMFLYIPLVDIASLTGNTEYMNAATRLWEDSVYRKTFLIGGIGSARFHEQFGEPYELPNLNCWNETCAAYGNILWNHRLFLLHHDAKYIDMLERILYNGWLVGVSINGDRFFYQNSLKSFGNYERFRWINVPCCPPNIVRLMASLGSYIYAKSNRDIFVNLFIGSSAKISLDNTKVQIIQETQYPWDGKVRLTINPDSDAKFALQVRIPIWTQNQPMPGDLYYYLSKNNGKPSIKLNKKTVDYQLKNGFARIERTWKKDDVIELDLPMPIRKVLSHPNVKDNRGRVALERGPLVYCAEWLDNAGNVMNLLVPDDARFNASFREDLLGGIVALKGKVQALHREGDNRDAKIMEHEMIAIPYYAWANRGAGPMAVWLARENDKARVEPLPPSPITAVTSSGGIPKSWTGYHDQNDDISAVYDEVDPLSSADESHLYFRLRPEPGQSAWIQYDLDKPTELSYSEVYFVDDKRFCRLPQSWQILYKQGDAWKPVRNHHSYAVEGDKFNSVSFDRVTTTGIRIEVQPQSILYKAGQIGPPAALFLDKDIEWRELGIIEWRIK